MAGPLYQGALELDEEDVDREAIEASAARISRPDPPSAWWWLLPPVMYGAAATPFPAPAVRETR